METKSIVMKFRTTPKIRNKILTRARTFADGNVSAFVEHQALAAPATYVPGASRPSPSRVAEIARAKKPRRT